MLEDINGILISRG